MDVLRPVRFVKGSGLCRFWFAQMLPEKQSSALLIKLPIFVWLPRHIIGPNVLKKIIIGNCEHRIKEQKTAIFTHTETCDRHLIGWCFTNLHAPATGGKLRLSSINSTITDFHLMISECILSHSTLILPFCTLSLSPLLACNLMNSTRCPT